MRHMIGGLAGLAAIGLAVSMPAMANMPAGTIPAFNQAVQSGDADAIVAAAKQFGAAAIAHPEDPQAAVAAFEAANQLCLRGACAEAAPMADFLMGLDGDLPVSREQVEILDAFARWTGSDGGDDATTAFGKVLEADVETPPSLLSVSAYEAYYLQKAGSTDWGDIEARAQLAAKHLLPARDALPARWAVAALMAGSARFNIDQEVDGLQTIADVEVWLHQKRSASHETGLRDVFYQAMAWRMALSAYFRSFDDRNRMRAAKIEKWVEDTEDQIDRDRALAPVTTGGGEDRGPPLCDGEIVKPPRPYYPNKAAWRGYVGAVIVGFDFVDGEPANFRVLASVPGDAFDKATLKSMETFRWKWDDTQDVADCTRSKENIGVYPFSYVMR